MTRTKLLLIPLASLLLIGCTNDSMPTPVTTAHPYDLYVGNYDFTIYSRTMIPGPQGWDYDTLYYSGSVVHDSLPEHAITINFRPGRSTRVAPDANGEFLHVSYGGHNGIITVGGQIDFTDRPSTDCYTTVHGTRVP